MSIWNCLKCGKCCRELFVKTGPAISNSEKIKILNYLNTLDLRCYLKNQNLSLDEIKKHFSERAYISVIGDKPPKRCIFLSDNLCIIHKVKPRICKEYPLEILPDEIHVDLDCPRGKEIQKELENGNYPKYLKVLIVTRKMKVRGLSFFEEKIRDFLGEEP